MKFYGMSNTVKLIVLLFTAALLSGCSGDSSGTARQTTWQIMYGGSGDDYALSIQETADGGYIVCGYSYSTDIPGVTNNGGSDYYIIKLNSDGSVAWQDMYGGSDDDYARTIQETADGGYIVCGDSWSEDIPDVTNHDWADSYIIKLNSDGSVAWQEMYGGGHRDMARSIRETADGGYIVCGYSYSTDIPGVTNNGEYDYYIIKLNSDGFVAWQKMYGGSGSDSAQSIQETSDGGYIVGGYSSSTNIPDNTHKGGNDYYIIKLDSDGSVAWQKMYGGSGDDYAWSIQETADGGYIVCGRSESTDILGVMNNGGNDPYVLKLKSDGSLAWQGKYGGGSDDSANSIQKTADGGYIVCGDSWSEDIPGVTNNGLSDSYIIKLDSYGYIAWQEMYGGGSVDSANSIQETADGGYIVCGESYSTDIPGVTNNGERDYYIIRLDSNGWIE
jgi:uncharacterized delta-60 repeat protein